jgi:glycosyltransferase involved in cell wall biosynthesis
VRVLAIGNMYPPHHLGGYELVWQAAMRRARARGHETRILTTDHREQGAGAEEDPDVHRELEWYWSFAENEWRRLGPLDRLRLERRNHAILERHLAEFAPDVVSFWSMGAMSLSLVERVAAGPVPSILVVHDDWLVYAPGRDAWMRLWGGRRRLLGLVAAPLSGIPARFSPRRPERVLTNSEFILTRAREQGCILPDAAVIPPGIDSRYLEPAPDREWGWRLLCVGRVDRQKGVDLAIDALVALPDEAKLTIAGSGDDSYQAELRAQAERLGVAGRVEFAGQVAGERLPELYTAADAVLFPVRWEEPFGLVPLEAMGVGRPVVATARGGAAEYLSDGENTIVVPPDDPEAIARAIRLLADDAELRRRLRDAGFETAAAHTSERFEDAIVDELERAAHRHRR